jgi:hypothetical protein
VDENWAMMVVQLAILTYPTMVFYFWLAPHVLWNDLRGIFIKQRHWQTELSVSQKNTKNQYSVLPGISVRVLASHFSSVIGNFRSSEWLDLHVWCHRMGVKTWLNRLILTYRRTLVLHYLLQSRGIQTVLLYIFIKQRHVRLIYMFSFFFWSPSLARKMWKTNMR